MIMRRYVLCAEDQNQEPGKMIVMPNNIYICQDCMQRTFDSINSSGMNYEDMMKMSNMPGMGMFGNYNVMDSDPVPESRSLRKERG